MPVQEADVAHAETSLRITRIYNSTPERVFDAWVDPAQMSKWMGPRPMVSGATVLELEPRVGGKFRVRMTRPPMEGDPSGNPTFFGVYLEFVRPSKLVFTWQWEHELIETLVTVTLRLVGAQTELTLLHENFTQPERREGHSRGWNASLDQLAAICQCKPSNPEGALMSSTMEVGKKLVALCREGKNKEAMDSLYSPDIVSVEAGGPPNTPREMKGIAAIKGKAEWWEANHTVHSAKIDGPWPNGDQFIVRFSYDVTAKAGPMAGKRFPMEEAALYTVKDGKVVHEAFFYHMGM